MLVNVALINRWGVWFGLTVATDGDLFLCSDEGGDGGEKEHKGKEAKITRRKEKSQEETGESVTEIRTHRSFTKHKVNNVWLGFNCNSLPALQGKATPTKCQFQRNTPPKIYLIILTSVGLICHLLLLGRTSTVVGWFTDVNYKYQQRHCVTANVKQLLLQHDAPLCAHYVPNFTLPIA